MYKYGVNHQFEVVEKEGDKHVIDHATGLSWQQSGSPESMLYADTEIYIIKLNNNHFSGYEDWRLPILEEVMYLMETEEENGNLYIDGVFDQRQKWIWTSDKGDNSFVSFVTMWVVNFIGNLCYPIHVESNSYVRAVR